MNIRTRLPLRVRAAPFEPGWALFNRLALRHGCATGAELATLLRLRDHGRFVRNVERGHRFADIAALTGIPSERILRSSIRLEGDNQVVLNGEILRKVRRIDAATIYARVCIDCLRDDLETRQGPHVCRPWRRAWWDAAAISTCPIHGSVLLAACPACGEAFDRKLLSPTDCRCGHHVLSASLQSVSPADAAGDAYVVGRLGGMDRIAHPFLDTVTLGDAVDIMRNTGSAYLWGRSIPRWLALEPLQRARALSTGFRICEDFPHGFEALLDRMLATRPRSRRSPIGVYGKLQYWLTQSGDPAFDPLRDALSRHVERSIPITPGTKVLGRPAAGGELTTLGSVAELCGCSEGRIATVATRLRLMNGIAYTAPRSTIIPKSIEAPLIEFFRSTCEAQEARTRLNVTRELFKGILDRGFVPRAFTLSGGGVPARYYHRDLNHLLARLHQRSQLLEEIPEGCVAVKYGVRKCWRSQIEIIEGLLRGDITAVGRLRHQHGIGQVIVNVNDVRNKLPRVPDETRLISVEAAAYLGTRLPTIIHLRKQGWLTETRKQTPIRKMPAFEREELDGFRREYVSTEELARMPDPRTRTKTVHEKLRQAGVLPAILGARNIATFYHRVPSEAIIREAFDPSRRKKRRARSGQNTSPSGRRHCGLN